MRLNRKTLSAANLIVQFRCKGLYDNWTQLTGFQPNNAVTFTDVVVAQTAMGVDGELSGGKVNAATGVALHFQANSQGIGILEFCTEYFKKEGNDVSPCELRIAHPSIKKVQDMEGFLVSGTGGTAAQELLAGSTFNFEMISRLENTN